MIVLLAHRTLDLPNLELHQISGFYATVRALILSHHRETLPVLELSRRHPYAELSVGHPQPFCQFEAESPVRVFLDPFFRSVARPTRFREPMATCNSSMMLTSC